MKLRILIVGAIVAGVVLLPATAWAKGAKDVTITGPGLATPVHLENAAGPTTVDVNRLAEATGLFYAAFRAKPTPMVEPRPAGRLGPRYRAAYELYVAQDKVEVVRQDLYPFAAAGFVSYTPPGQRAFEHRTQSGWYVSTNSATATAMLVTLGASRLPIRQSRPS
jgi:hypothetical protein